jgi:hypothetical protein
VADAFAILERVNALYSTAFSQLIAYTVGVIAFIGVLVPIGIAVLQQKRLAHDRAMLQLSLKADLENKLQELSGKLDAKFAEEQKRLTMELARQEALTRGGLSHTSGAIAREAGQLGAALLLYANAICHTAQAREERNMRSAIANVVEMSKKADVPSMDVPARMDIAQALHSSWQAVHTVNENNRYAEEIRSLQIIEAYVRSICAPATT